MRKVFPEEVARELGYQKYWPEKKDWVLGIVFALSIMLVFTGVLFGVLKATGQWDRVIIERTCDDYGGYSISNLPAKCAKQYGVSGLTN